MFYLVKLFVSAGMIVLVSEISKKWPGLGGLLASLPLTSLLGILWLYGETKDLDKIMVHSQGIFWYVLPSLPLFLILPWLLKQQVAFGWALGFSCVFTMGLYVLMMRLLQTYGIFL